MNLLKTKLRRTSAVIAGSIIGLAGAAVFASPASAHAPTVSGDTSCIKEAGGSWDIKWSIGNDYQAEDHDGRPVTGAIESVKLYTTDGKELSSEDVTLTGADKGTPVPFGDGTVTAHSTVKDKDLDAVKIAVSLTWSDGYSNKDNPVTAKVDKPEVCKPDTPPSTPESSSPTPTPSASTPSNPEVPAPTLAEPIVKFDCTTETIGLDNSKGSIPVTLELKTTKGETRSFTVQPGDQPKTEMFSATEGFSVRVTAKWTENGKPKSDFADVKWQKPADCDNNGQGGGLPVTGAAAGGIAGGAAVLLVAGGALFVMARRRKVKFTA